MPTTGTLGGQVNDEVTGAPIVGAIVTLNTGETGITSLNGVYVFPKIDVGDYIVSVSAEGYITTSQTATISAGITTRLDFALMPIIPTPVASPTQTSTAIIIPTPIASPTSTPIHCEAENIESYPKTLKLKKEESGNVTITGSCIDGYPDIGETVTAKIKSGKKRISISPQSAMTDVSGQAIVTITATDKTGNAKVKFETTNDLKTTITVKIKAKETNER